MSDISSQFDIWIKPIFVKDDIEYPFEGLAENEKGGFRGLNFEFRFIVDTLRHYFGDDLDFDDDEDKIKIKLKSYLDLNTLQLINYDTCDFPVKYGRSHLKFEISKFN